MFSKVLQRCRIFRFCLEMIVEKPTMIIVHMILCRYQGEIPWVAKLNQMDGRLKITRVKSSWRSFSFTFDTWWGPLHWAIVDFIKTWSFLHVCMFYYLCVIVWYVHHLSCKPHRSSPQRRDSYSLCSLVRGDQDDVALASVWPIFTSIGIFYALVEYSTWA